MGAVARYLVAGLAVALVLALWRLDHVSTNLSAATDQVGTLERAAASRKATQKLLTLSLIHI